MWYSPGRFLALVVLILFADVSYAVARQVTFVVRSVTHDDTDRPLQLAAMEALETALVDRGATPADKPYWMFLVAAKKIDDGSRIALSVVSLVNLRDSDVALAREGEIFYAGLSDSVKAALPEEGRFIRQYVSEDYIRQFAMPQDMDVLVVGPSDLESGMRKVVDRFYRHFHF